MERAVSRSSGETEGGKWGPAEQTVVGAEGGGTAVTHVDPCRREGAWCRWPEVENKEDEIG